MDLHRLKEIAVTLDNGESVFPLIEAAQNSQCGGQTKIAILGNFNAGKTTLLNTIAGQELRKVSAISEEDEQPVRLSFERMDPDPNFKCFDVYDSSWNDEDVIIYDLKFSDVFEAGELKPVMYDMDIVFYLVSALQVFTAVDMHAIEMLKNFKIKVILTKLDAVEEDSKEKIIKYVNDRCEELGLENALLLMDKDSGSVAKTLRGVLPDFVELEQIRKNRAAGFAKTSVEKLKSIAGSKLTAEVNASEQQQVLQEDYLATSLNVKNILLNRGIEYSSSFTVPDDKKHALANKIFMAGNENNFDKIWSTGMAQSSVEMFLEEYFEQIKKNLITVMKEDYWRCAQELEFEVSEEVNREIVQIAQKKPVYVEAKNSPTFGKQDVNVQTKKKVAVAAAIVAGTLIVPIPMWASIAITLGAAGYSVNAINEGSKQKCENNNQAIFSYSSLVLSHFNYSIKEYINDCYNRLADVAGRQYVEDKTQVMMEEDINISIEHEWLVSLLEELDKMYK